MEIFVDYFGSDKIAMVPRSSIADRVNAARVLTPRVKWNETNCARGLDGLRSWRYEYDDEKKIFSSDPLHDWASHDGDGYSYGCLIMQMAEPAPKPLEGMRGIMVGNNSMTLDEMWASTPRRNEGRI